MPEAIDRYPKTRSQACLRTPSVRMGRRQAGARELLQLRSRPAEPHVMIPCFSITWPWIVKGLDQNRMRIMTGSRSAWRERFNRLERPPNESSQAGAWIDQSAATMDLHRMGTSPSTPEAPPSETPPGAQLAGPAALQGGPSNVGSARSSHCDLPASSLRRRSYGPFLSHN